MFSFFCIIVYLLTFISLRRYSINLTLVPFGSTYFLEKSTLSRKDILHEACMFYFAIRIARQGFTSKR